MAKVNKLLSLFVFGLLTFVISFCVGCAPKTQSVSLDKTITYKNICTINVPDDWSERATDDDDSVLVNIPGDGVLVLAGYNLNDELDKGYVRDTDIEKYINEYFDGVYQSGEIQIAESETSADHNISQQSSLAMIAKDEVVFTDTDGRVFKGICQIKTNSGNMGTVMILVPEEDYDNMKDTINKVLATFDVEFANSVDTDRTQREYDDAMEKLDSNKPSSSSGISSATPSQSNAVKMAKSYLDYSAFSHQGLIEQLEYEGFSKEDATYGADNCGADWNEQAAKMAKEYLDYSSFSRKGLIEQLEYEGFTNDQAKYGVQAAGL